MARASIPPSVTSFLKDKWALAVAILLGIVGLVDVGTRVATVNTAYARQAQVDGIVVVQKDADNKIIFHDKEIALLRQAVDDLKDTNKEIRDILRKYNDQVASPTRPSPFPIPNGSKLDSIDRKK